MSAVVTSTDVLAVYDTLASIGETVLEIEILPEALGPFLKDDGEGGGDVGYIGVTKKALVRAFTTARRVFFESRKLRETEEDAASASAVILVFDSEHLTACNWRKRRIQSRAGDDDRGYRHLLSVECNFTASLLRSPLHRHAKSPTLWYHRFWVMAQHARLPKSEPESKSEVEMLKAEVDLVLRAAGHHPMNYYAFSYLRQYLALLARIVGGDDGDRSDHITYEVEVDPAANRGVTSRLISDAHLVTTVRDWCLRNPGDNSGWMFLLHLLSLMDDGDIQHDVVQWVILFGFDVRWQKEALWTFVQLAVLKFKVVSDLACTVAADSNASASASEQGQGQGRTVASETSPDPRPWKRWARRAAIPTTI
ncbi:uncharacterized protein GIQ15_01479 [Arthroderma uncinatum]|uniref:uncharacterized protein n=1 Tax=Arthroderma uncinatum TaxID=74035 RepID=UPI00144ADB62|nr:uncharacterized protein GIQ15_01479 [Arthroderma uncinatum]KAF3491962.1 hypothetical protein GIQ15_01479 [Arthroderma uncinatum]